MMIPEKVAIDIRVLLIVSGLSMLYLFYLKRQIQILSSETSTGWTKCKNIITGHVNEYPLQCPWWFGYLPISGKEGE